MAGQDRNRISGRELRNIGIFAHVDAGKTTTTEQILYRSGRIRTPGSVDDGTAQTDWLDVERERGISVRAAVTRFEWRGVSVNLVDTPGHVDFLSEVERSLRVMDGAVLIVSAAEGVQAQTEIVWHALREKGIPTIIYVNKMDRVGADAEAVLGQIRKLLSTAAAPIQAPVGAEADFAGCVELLPMDRESAGGEGAELYAAGFERYMQLLQETVAESDETLLLRYFEQGALTVEELVPVVKDRMVRTELFPVLFGASGRGIGVERLMDAMIELLPAPAGDTDAEAQVAGVVFKLERDPAMGRIAYVRLYGGTIRNRDSVYNESRDAWDKVTQIRKVDGRKSEDVGVLEAGDIAAVYGLNRARIGDVLGTSEGVPGEQRLAVPLLTVQVHWANEAEYPAVVAAFQELADEDPLLDLQWLPEERELHLKVMGAIQMEVLTQLVQSRFGLTITFGAPSVIYKETLAGSGEGFIAYTMPKPCWAILRFRMEPGERGSGLQYLSVVRPEHLLESYQNEVARRVPEALQQGLRGWEVTDLKVTLVEGEHHVWHTHPLDFVVATPMGIMNGLANIGTKLLEPILRFRLSAPEEFGGKLMNELILMRGAFDAPVIAGGRIELEGTLPVATSLDFPARLGSMTKGRGILSAFFEGYRECPPDVDAERPRRGVNPLDQSKWILATRNALSAG
ncbi:TetM/TetW/TetO/TetS family tetracycline resistance ribosomal protection protein [Cohnella lubricantis]|uniref:TetM/TetW/TetO/TetS family tetracycline resistance ribosomal protection protein n=1 Tax=Cohnella lubricantis TaxID=2163172 RepID=A0A841T725_9BACL|nr:TetM/TetW/TetO/TetS family tetracycline resistance ribosomal protection protein [Cohnella lubricantis]MBB6676692.1 TetM/TetW/TetO/TetS family tetracycline resistance ribosomal protection protein [Cohnella lubricantis]MBP2117738.1 ribosomal protection tetracycline resistance protein [Cohnella lubricantis]